MVILPDYEMSTSTTHLDGSGNKRSACNRCRSHKLRCERNPNMEFCRRCIKANATCVTGTAIKSGRPIQLYGGSTQSEIPRNVPSMQHQLSLPELPTPPPTILGISLETPFGQCAVDLDMQLDSPSDFIGFDDWNDHDISETGLPNADLS